MSSLLFYGPGARVEALRRAHLIGNLMSPPLGDEGLKTEEARLVVEILSSAPMGSKKGVVVVGPLDLATEKASDVLLKAVEEHREEWVQPILWAEDLGAVKPTIQSRCLSEWVPGELAELDEEIVHIIDAALDDDLPELLVLLGVYEGKPIEIVRHGARVLASDPTKKAMDLWARLRGVARYLNPTPLEVAMALVGG